MISGVRTVNCYLESLRRYVPVEVEYVREDDGSVYALDVRAAPEFFMDMDSNHIEALLAMTLDRLQKGLI